MCTMIPNNLTITIVRTKLAGFFFFYSFSFVYSLMVCILNIFSFLTWRYTETYNCSCIYVKWYH